MVIKQKHTFLAHLSRDDIISTADVLSVRFNVIDA